MGKKIQLVSNYLGVTLLISLVFLSSTQQALPSTKQTLSLIYTGTLPATYPKLNFSTYLGGSNGSERGNGIAVTEDDSCYITGRTGSSDFPTKNAFNSSYSGETDAIVAKLNGSGSLLWSTYLGGNGFEQGFSIAITKDGSCYVTGSTWSSNFPTQNAYNNTYNGNFDAFITKFADNGSLLWSTYLGGSEEDFGFSIAVSIDGSCYVTGKTRSSNFPTLNAYDSTFNGGYFDAFISKFSSNGTLLWSSYLGGKGNDWGTSIAIASDGSFYVTGLTTSYDFPNKDAYDATYNGDWDCFVIKFTAYGSLFWSTFLGGVWWDESWAITVAGDNSCYVTGYTVSNDFPIKYAFNNTNGGWGDAFITKFADNGSLLWSTFFGGNGCERGYDIAVTTDGNCYVTGETFSTNFPIKNAFDSTYNGTSYDTFVSKFSSDGFLIWSTYLGGSRTDRGQSIAVTEEGCCFITGSTWSNDFPIQNAYDNTLSGVTDIIVTKFDDSYMSSTPPGAVNGFLVFIATTSTIAFLLIFTLILYKKWK